MPSADHRPAIIQTADVPAIVRSYQMPQERTGAPQRAGALHMVPGCRTPCRSAYNRTESAAERKPETVAADRARLDVQPPEL